MYKYPFSFNIGTSVNLADEEELLFFLVKAGIGSNLVCIETPVEESLHHCIKVQNKNRDLLESVKKIQKAGLQVSGGFIVGFDSDKPSVFQRQIGFIQKSGIGSAMVGLLNAPKRTKLYQQLKAENRLTTEANGSNTDLSMNFIPKMNYNELLDCYKKIIQSIYSTKPLHNRLRQWLINYERHNNRRTKISFPLIKALFKSAFIIGILNKGRSEN